MLHACSLVESLPKFWIGALTPWGSKKQQREIFRDFTQTLQASDGMEDCDSFLQNDSDPSFISHPTLFDVYIVQRR
jgi:hypothetical protein